MSTEGDTVKIDLVIGDENDPTGEDLNEDTATEVICLRILSNKTRFRFGGMEITVKSPAFEVGKTFSVSLDENNRLAGIESFQEYYPPSFYHHGNNKHAGGHNRDRSASPSSRTPSCTSSRRVSLVNSLGLKPARIIVNPSDESDHNEGLPILSARLALEEDIPPIYGRGAKSFSMVNHNNSSSRSPTQRSPIGSPSTMSPIHMKYGRPGLISPSSLTPLPSPFRRTPSPSRISKLIGLDDDSSLISDSSVTLNEKKFVSVGVGTTSNPKESLSFALERTLRRSNSWKK